MKEVYKVILDTDPGVDDTTALTFALNDPQFDIKLITISSGNIHMAKASRNLCHLLDIFEKDIPVVDGYEKRMGGTSEHAYFLHGKEGLGAYNPPKTTHHKPLQEDCADAMYRVLEENPHEVTIVVLGPHTNFAYLLKKYPNSKNLIKNVFMMGASLDGIKTDKNHRSFNIRTDAVAFRKTIESQIPVTMCPSKIGRDVTFFTEEQVQKIKAANDVGKFLAQTFETYWEPGYEQKILSTCDLSAIYSLTHPELYKFKKAFVDVDTEVNIGATIGHYDKRGFFNVVQNVKRKKFMKMIFEKLKEFDNLKIKNKTFQNNIK